MGLNDKKNQEKTPAFNEVWQILKETAKERKQFSKERKESHKAFKEEMKESRIKFDKDLKESQIKSDKDIKESRIEFNKKLEQSRIEFDKKMNKMRGIWSNAWGDFVESLVSGCLVKMLQEWIPSINQIMKNIECHRNGLDCEIDIIAVNNESLVAVEVKSTLNVKDVNNFLEKLQRFAMFFPQFKNYNVYGAVAYLKVAQGADNFAMKQGLFVIRATSDSGEILNKKGAFKPQIIKQIP